MSGLTGNDAARRIGVVAIGRNEGDRLTRCLQSCANIGGRCVYVDSGSTDGSVKMARGLGASVVELDMTQPFTAARARNAGFRALLEAFADIEFVQFVDGDCELGPQWLAMASAYLDAHPEVVVVAGRRKERYPDASVYNRLCDIEWDTPVGEARAVGGDAMFRVASFLRTGGYRDDLIAGEEPELCVRLRASGGRIWRLDADMTWHDAAIQRLSQWWRRTMRSGYAFAEGAALHGAPPERHFVSETRRALVWGVALPALIGLACCWHPWAAILFVVYPLQWLRLGRRFAGKGDSIPWSHAGFLVLGRFPEAQGALKFLLGRLFRRSSGLIEYK
jgi:glycosyltransferase involved in cell wall biosynthesis